LHIYITEHVKAKIDMTKGISNGRPKSDMPGRPDVAVWVAARARGHADMANSPFGSPSALIAPTQRKLKRTKKEEEKNNNN
jgi:hypothetical protein